MIIKKSGRYGFEKVSHSPSPCLTHSLIWPHEAIGPTNAKNPTMIVMLKKRVLTASSSRNPQIFPS